MRYTIHVDGSYCEPGVARAEEIGTWGARCKSKPGGEVIFEVGGLVCSAELDRAGRMRSTCCEVVAVEMGLFEAARLGLASDRLTVCIDEYGLSRHLIRSLTRLRLRPHCEPLPSIYEPAVQSARRFPQLKIQHIPRRLNRAHRLAAEARRVELEKDACDD